MSTSDLQPLPQPGLAVFPHLVQQEFVTYMLRRLIRNSQITLVDPDGGKVLAVTGRTLDKGRCIMDLATDQELTMMRKGKNQKTYYAEAIGGLRTFDIETEGDCIILHCANALDENQRTQIEYHSETKAGSKRTHGEVIWQGSTVARIDVVKKFGMLQYKNQLQVAPGMDPFLVLAVAVVAITQRNVKNKPKDEAAAVPSNDGATASRMSHKDVDTLSRKALHRYKDSLSKVDDKLTAASSNEGATNPGVSAGVTTGATIAALGGGAACSAATAATCASSTCG